MFFDEAKIYVKSGDGGPGMMHFRREAHVPRGGPDGGDGGRGGDVILVASPTVNTLIAFSRKQRFIAHNGAGGGAKSCTGASADDLRINVPLGTVIRDVETQAVIADLIQPDQPVIVAKGGRGGRGNERFVSSTNQAPRLAEKGEPGEERWLKLELKLIADVGIVGVPNAGKSTLLSVISNARPKIAAYPFTTLEPSLGVVVVGDRDIVFADIPGLVEGAHLGIGLGHAFLRHIQRTRILVHLLNGEAENPLADFNQINAELALFDPKLGEKPQIVVLNKMDLPEAQERWPAVEAALRERGYETMSISAATQRGTQDLVNRVAAMLAQLPAEPFVVEGETPVYALDNTKAFTISRAADGGYRVSGVEIERAAKMTYWELDESAARFQRILAALGITRALEEAGIQRGDTVYIGDYELEWGD
ncbi:MAG TPA: GTPase ObgE [Aggregatilineales bacterium]|nr:GTPase ObgE [Aggregatilineales bacterium]